MKVLASLGLILALSGCANVEKGIKVPEISEEAQIQLDNKLFKAILDDDLKAVQQSLKEGANINIKIAPPIALAAGKGHTEIVKFLLEKGANINAKVFGEITALMYASMNGHPQTVKFLLDHGADVNATSNLSRNTALIVASLSGHTEIAKILLDHGADINARNLNKTSPLLAALCLQRKETAKFLIGKGADVNAHNMIGVTPLMVAAVREYTDIVKLLISKKANINAKDIKNATVLDKVEFLLTHKEIKIFRRTIKLNTNRKKLMKIKKILRAHGAKLGSELK